MGSLEARCVVSGAAVQLSSASLGRNFKGESMGVQARITVKSVAVRECNTFGRALVR